MEPLYFVMAILGCGDDGQSCQQARLEPARYASVSQCQAAMANSLERHSDLSFPVVQATCQRRGANVAQQSPQYRG